MTGETNEQKPVPLAIEHKQQALKELKEAEAMPPGPARDAAIEKAGKNVIDRLFGTTEERGADE